MLRSSRFVRTFGIFTHRKAPPTRPKYACTYHPACQLGGNCTTPLPSDSPCLVWRGRVLSCHDKSNTLRQQQQQLADILVQVPPNNDVPCCRVGGSRGDGGWWWLCRCCCACCIRFGALFSLNFLAGAVSSSTCDYNIYIYIYISGFGVVR